MDSFIVLQNRVRRAVWRLPMLAVALFVLGIAGQTPARAFMVQPGSPALADISADRAGTKLLLVRHEDKSHDTPGDVKRHYQSQGQKPPRNYQEKFYKRKYQRNRRHRSEPFYRKHKRRYRNDYRSSHCDYIHYRCAQDWGYGTQGFYGCIAYNGCY